MSFIKNDSFTANSPSQEMIVTIKAKDFLSASVDTGKGFANYWWDAQAVLTAIGSPRTFAAFKTARQIIPAGSTLSPWDIETTGDQPFYNEVPTNQVNANGLAVLLHWADPAAYPSDDQMVTLKALNYRVAFLTSYRDDQSANITDSPIKWGYMDMNH